MRSFLILLMQIFFSGAFTAAQMFFAVIVAENAFYLAVQEEIYMPQACGDIGVKGAFAVAKICGGLTDGGMVFNYVFGGAYSAGGNFHNVNPKASLAQDIPTFRRPWLVPELNVL